jgi:single-strand selective monofunctional uracil DNA glycosylase
VPDLKTPTRSPWGRLQGLRFSAPVAVVYNPLEYARDSHAAYLEKYGRGRRDVLLLGMNPGPWGMAQTGIPFGEVNMVRDWLGIDTPVGRPKREHPKRPVQGFECKRSEVSGRRLWGWARDTFGTPERFFRRFFIINYCPLCFMEESGRNLTPDKLPARERDPLLKICDEALRAMVEQFRPRWVIGVGGFAEKRARIALDGMDLRIGSILHPSPASPAANRNWVGQVNARFAEYGIKLAGG